MIFWLVAGATLLVVVGLLARTVFGADAEQSGAAQDMDVYRDQLREVEKDVARGVLTADAAERTRLEISRRLLEADRNTGIGHGVGPRSLAITLAAVIVVGITIVTYLQIGAPGYPDLPLKTRIAQLEDARASRPSQAVAEEQVTSRPAPQINAEDVSELMTQLRAILQQRPDDLRGHRLLVRNEAGLGNMVAAYTAQQRVIEILGVNEAPASEVATLAELMILAAGGYVSPEAEAVLQNALGRDPRNGTARYYTGLMYVQAGRYDLAWPTWRRLLADSTADAPWLEPILLQIEDVSALAGNATPLDQLPIPRADEPVTGTGGLRGPSSDDIEAAGEMSMQDRIQMIQGMVQGLAERLGSEGGPPEEWARLITSLGVLGNTDAAFGVYSEAILVFEGDQGALDILNHAADQAGVNPG